MNDYQPQIFYPHKDKEQIKEILKKDNVQIYDKLEYWINDYNDTILDNKLDKLTVENNELYIWVYYPWKNILLKILNFDLFYQLKTARNKFLITDEEQNMIKQSFIGVTGLNVGNSALISLVLEGFLKFRIADNDVLSVSNLNRFDSSLINVGLPKTEIIAKHLYELNPFIELEIFDKGVVIGSEELFINNHNQKIDILIEEMDNLKLKISLRRYAKQLQVPVIMVTGNGSNLILDIERYDLNPNLDILNGYLDKNIINIIDKDIDISIEQKNRLAMDFMGENYLVDRLRDSFKKLGLELTGIPQLAETTFLRGAVLSYVVREILLKNKTIKSGRYFFNMDDIFKN